MHGISLSNPVVSHPVRANNRSEQVRERVYGLWMSAVCGYQRYRQRRALALLDDRLLRDIGISREQAGRETAKPFWRG